MKTGIIILALTIVLAAGFAFAGPATEAPGAAAAAEGPQYGGTLTMLHQRTVGDPPSPAQKDSQVQAIEGWLAAMQEHLVQGDYEKFGGMGTGEFMFEFSDYIPWKYIKGHLIEDWELSADRALLHVRPGIYWAPTEKQKAWMPVRELVAEDIAFDINTFWHAPWGRRFDGTLARETYARDKYTVVCEFENFNNQFLYYIGFEDRAVYSPPELEDNNPHLWENQVGTGPFMFESYTIGSSMTFKKNPDYWYKTTIDGKEYQLPFIDRLVFPIIPDAATMMSAVRTGKVDFHMEPQIGQWDNYDKISSHLNRYIFAPGSGQAIGFNTTKAPFNNAKVRQAVSIGTDRAVFAKLLRSEALPIRFHPQSSNNLDFFVADNELPADVAQLYKYDANKAKQMLAEAGYPNGFKTKIFVRNVALDQDVAAIVKEQWSKIGVDAEIMVMEPSAFAQTMYAVTYDGVCIPGGLDAANPVIVLVSEGKTGAWYNFSGWSNPEFDALMARLEGEMDEAKQGPLVKEASKIMMREAPYLALAPRASRIYWWDWVKNYYGEFSLTDGAPHQMIPFMWLDQNLKKSLGF